MEDARKKLIRQIEELKSMEDAAFRLYKDLLPLITNPADRKDLQKIIHDEQSHSLLASKIIELLRDQ